MRQPLSIYVRAADCRARRFYEKLGRRATAILPRGQAFSRGNAAPRINLERESLRRAVADLGIASGDTVLVHSGISHLGKVVGGPRSVFEVIRDAVGEHGHVLYPVFPFDSLMYTYLASAPTFDVRSAGSRMGSLTTYALTIPGGVRSVHPTHSVLAFGRAARDLCGEHHLCSTPFGERSPFARLVAANGKILLLGVGLNSTTSFHRTEDRLGDLFPVKVYLPGVFKVSCVDAQGASLSVTTPSHDPFISQVRDCDLVKNDFVRSGVLREKPLGNGTVAAIDAAAMDRLLEELCRQQMTIYGRLWG